MLVAGFDVRVPDLEALIQGLDLDGMLALEDRFLKKLQQHLVEPAKLHHDAIIVLHEAFDGELILIVAQISELGRYAPLIVEEQTILAPPGEGVEGEANAP